MEKSALVTGGSGFIGSHLVGLLVSEGWRVRILDRALPAHRSPSLFAPHIEFIEGDIRDFDACQRALSGVDTVFHLAALTSVEESVRHPWEYHDVNVNGTLTLLQAAREAHVRRFIFSSSASVYGETDAHRVHEGMPVRPMSPYASSKVAGEMYCRNFADLYGLDCQVLRYFNVFGPSVGAKKCPSVVDCFLDAILGGESPHIYGDGSQTRDFIYVGEIARANRCAALAKNRRYSVCNVASGAETSIISLFDALQVACDSPISPEFHGTRPGEIQRSVACVKRANRRLGFVCATSLSDGIAHTVTAHRLFGIK